MTNLQMTICSSLVLLSLASAGPLCAAEADRDLAVQINTANGLLREGDLDGALAAYQEAEQLGPPSADLTYNRAVAQYRKGDVAAAAQHFESVAASDDDAIAAKARFNLGNCDYVAALQQAEKDRPAAIERLESAIKNYRSSLAVDADDAEARANIELAAQMIDKLREEEEQEQQQQQQQDQQQNQENQSQQDQEQQQQDQQDQQQESGEKQDQQQSGQQDQEQQQDEQSQQQQDQSDSNKEGKEQENSEQSTESQQQGEQAQDQQSQEEQSDSEQSAQENSESEPQQQDSQGEQQQESATQPQSKQNQSQQQSAADTQTESPLPEADNAQGEQGKQPPKGELSAAESTDQKDAADRQATPVKALEEGEMTEQEAEKMLQAIRDRDMIRRLRRQAAERNQHIPVDRDW